MAAAAWEPPLSDRRPTRIQTENRGKIRAAALEVFSREGFRGATIDAIAELAGMSKPNLLYYFSSKEGIYREVLERLLADWLAPRWDAAAVLKPDLDQVPALAAPVAATDPTRARKTMPRRALKGVISVSFIERQGAVLVMETVKQIAADRGLKAMFSFQSSP